MFWMVDGSNGKIVGWASDVDTRDRMLEHDSSLFALEEEEDNCLTQGMVAVFVGGCSDWSGISVSDNKFVVEHVTDDTKTTKVVVDTWFQAVMAAHE